jgi:predicted ATP-grasp superfamily ATP-dependent carboligase
MLAAITADFAAIPDVQVTTILDQRIANRSLDPRIHVTHITGDDEPDVFRKLASESDFALIIAPEFDGILHRRCEQALAAGARLLGPTPDAVALCSDKLALAQHWDAAGVPTPPTMPRTDKDPPFASPWIVKPRFGAGSRGIHIVYSPDQPSRPADDEIIQPLMRGFPASVAFLIGPNQTVALSPCAQRLNVEYHYLGGSTPLPSELATRATAIAQSAIAGIPGLCGYIGVDVVLGERDWAIEINPRLTTSYLGLRQLCAGNLADALLRVVRGEQVELAWKANSFEWRVASGEEEGK